MKEMRNVKIRVDMYDDTKFKIIDTKPERDLIHYIWTRMLTLAGKVNLEGKLYLSRNIPYTDETLAIEFNRDVMQVRLAFKVLIELEMIVMDDDNVYQVKNFSKHQNGNRRKRTTVENEFESKDELEDNKKDKGVYEKDEVDINENNSRKEVEQINNIENSKDIKENKNDYVKIERAKVCSNASGGLLDLPYKNKSKRKNSKKVDNKNIVEIEEDKDTEFIEFYEGDRRSIGKDERIIMEFKI